MQLRGPRSSDCAEQWQGSVVLKRDVFSTVERGRFIATHGEVDAIRRRIDEVPWWTRPLAGHLLRREQRALAIAGTIGVGPPLLCTGRGFLIRGFLYGVALKMAKPTGDLAYFRSAQAALMALHRAGVCHNDLAKEQNWLRGSDGRAYLLDFQLAATFTRRTKLFRIAAYEDLRHLLKHKRKYVPASLTARERHILARKALATRLWMATGKRLYLLITRGVFGVIDAEGGGRRLVYDAPKIEHTLKAQPHVRDAVVVAFPDRRAGTGLYAFVEADGPLEEAFLNPALATALGQTKAPEFLQIVDALPRDHAGRVRAEILHLIATNQTDLIAPLITSTGERDVVDRIATLRRNYYGIPQIEAAFRTHPQVRDLVIVAFPHRLTGTGLYAFVETNRSLGEETLRAFIVNAVGKDHAPRYIHPVEALPRDPAGKIRNDILQFIAMNQIEFIGPLVRSPSEQQIVDRILADRRNLHDRFVL
jgi:AMP-binding enzyme C-terminal domain